VINFLVHAEEFLEAHWWEQFILAFLGGSLIAFGAALSVVISTDIGNNRHDILRERSHPSY